MSTTAWVAPGQRARRRGGWHGTIPLLGALLALYLIVPIVVMIVHLGARAGTGLETSGLWSALAISLLTASVATAIITVFGLPLAWVLSQPHSRVWSAVGVAVQLPLALPPLMSGILLVEVVGPYTFVGRLLHGALTDTPGAIVLAQTFVAAPFLVIAARSAFETVPSELLEVAETLGHGRWSRFRRVALPVSARGIRAGMLLSWLRAFGEFGATVILAYHPYSLPVFTFVRFDSTGLPSALPATGVAVLAAAAVLTLASLRLSAPRRWLRRCFATGLSPLAHPAVPPAPERIAATDRPPAAAYAPVHTPEPLSFDLRDRLGGFELGLAYRAQSGRLALLGASGAGKSLALRCLAGLRGTGVGEVALGARGLGALPPAARRIGLVPQGQSLVPGLDVWRQVNFGVGTDPALAARWIAALGLTELVDRTPDQLSGGQRQRVALARALAYEPDLLLLDEPLGALDRPVREELRRELRRVQRDTGVSTVIVTHDLEEAAMLADDVAVIEDGALLQAGARAAVFGAPASARVARLLAIANVGAGRVVDDARLSPVGSSTVVAVATELPEGTEVLWCVRAEDVTVDAGQPRAGYDALVLDVLDLGSASELLVRLEGGLELRSRRPRGSELSVGDRVRVSVPPHAITVWLDQSLRARTAVP